MCCEFLIAFLYRFPFTNPAESSWPFWGCALAHSNASPLRGDLLRSRVHHTVASGVRLPTQTVSCSQTRRLQPCVPHDPQPSPPPHAELPLSAIYCCHPNSSRPVTSLVFTDLWRCTWGTLHSSLCLYPSLLSCHPFQVSWEVGGHHSFSHHCCPSPDIRAMTALGLRTQLVTRLWELLTASHPLFPWLRVEVASAVRLCTTWHLRPALTSLSFTTQPATLLDEQYEKIFS